MLMTRANYVPGTLPCVTSLITTRNVLIPINTKQKARHRQAQGMSKMTELGGAGLGEFHPAGLQGLSQNRSPRLPSQREAPAALSPCGLCPGHQPTVFYLGRCTGSRLLSLIGWTGAATALLGAPLSLHLPVRPALQELPLQTERGDAQSTGSRR